MTTIKITTQINASLEEVFNLNRDIDFHQYSASQTQEKAIFGRTSGLIELNETVKWKGKHFGFWLTHTSKITQMEFPNSFTDEMIEGNFKYFKHQHYFTKENEVVYQKDILEYQTPFGVFGWLFDQLILKSYLEQFIKKRNYEIKTFLEKRVTK